MIKIELIKKETPLPYLTQRQLLRNLYWTWYVEKNERLPASQLSIMKRKVLKMADEDSDPNKLAVVTTYERK